MTTSTTKNSHIHFGAGHIGIGLVLPVLSKDVRLAIFQRHSPEWESLTSSTTIELTNSKEYTIKRLRIFRDDEKTTEKQIKDLHKGWLKGDSNLFILASDWKKYQLFIKDAPTISCALKEGQSHLAEVLSDITFAIPPTVFPFENDIKKAISSLSNVKVTRVMADRICVGRRIETTKVIVSAEDSGEVVINASEADYPQLFKASKNVTVQFKQDEHIFDYYNDRKRYLVNGLHFALATFAYHFLSEVGIPARHWGIQYLPIMQGVLLSKGGEYLSHIENYMDGQIMRLILRDKGSIETEYPDLEDDEDRFDLLRSFSERVLHRTSEHLDNLERILDITSPEKALAILDKFHRHLEEAKKDIFARNNEIDELPIRRRPYADDVSLSLDYLTSCVINVTNVARSQIVPSPQKQGH
jgi:hypothetical protein